MEKDKICLIQLRDCFTASYTLPQYCIDNGIKKPLFVSEKKFLSFMWEVHVQFQFDKRIFAQFSFLDLPTGSVNFFVSAIVKSLTYKNFSAINPADFDKIILLTTKPVNVADKMLSFADLKTHFVYMTYLKTPLLHFMQRYPQAKLILTKYPYIGQYKGGKEFSRQLTSLERTKALLRKNKNDKIDTPLPSTRHMTFAKIFA